MKICRLQSYKKIFFTPSNTRFLLRAAALLLLLEAIVYSQNITNTIGPGSLFTIKDASANLMTLAQSNGQINIFRTLNLENTFNSSTGVILKGPDRFLHTYGSVNLFFGINSGNFTSTGYMNTGLGWRTLIANTTGYQNLALGLNALSNNTTGYDNTGLGTASLENNTNGYQNTSVGSFSLYFNTTGNMNTAVGVYTLLNNVGGSSNSAFGHSALYANTSGFSNTASGVNALNSNLSGYYNSAFGVNSLRSNTSGFRNSAFGTNSLFSNTIGFNNSAFGYNVLYSNSSGNMNSAFGNHSLYANSTGSNNSAFGDSTLRLNISGSNNSAFGFRTLLNNNANLNNAFGYQTLRENVNGTNNTAFGHFALLENISGNENVAIGHNSLLSCKVGNFNTGVGNWSLYNSVNGNGNVAIGFYAGYGITGSNTINIGYDVNAGPNSIRIGNNLINYAGIQIAWSVTSDQRLKTNIESLDLGLNFINKLRPVKYIRTNDSSEMFEYGFIAQEVEEILITFKSDNYGLVSKNENGDYELRYNDFVAPIIKSIQQLKEQYTEVAETDKHTQNEMESKISSQVELERDINTYEEKQTKLWDEINKIKSGNVDLYKETVKEDINR